MPRPRFRRRSAGWYGSFIEIVVILVALGVALTLIVAMVGPWQSLDYLLEVL